MSYRSVVEVSNQQIADLMVSALEGGSNYWIDSVTPIYKSHGDYSQAETYGPDMIPRKFTAFDNEACGTLDDVSIQRGLNIMAEKYPRHLADFVSDNADAITADVFLQCCVFGEVVFG